MGLGARLQWTGGLQRLSFHSHELDDSSSLEEARIFDGSLVHLQLSSEPDPAPAQTTEAALAHQDAAAPHTSRLTPAEEWLIDLSGSTAQAC